MTKYSIAIVGIIGGVAALGAMGSRQAYAMELDWGGDLRSEFNFVYDYTLDPAAAGGLDANRAKAGGYYIPGGGSNNATFETLFLRLKPKLIVNDNISIKSEWWLGNPIYGFFGDAAPYTSDQRQYYSTQSRGSTISAQRVWAEVLTDIGTLQVGRAPLDWGLGIVWNKGDGLWDNYESTGDLVRMVSNFGNFSIVPAIIWYDIGNSIGGAYDVGVGPVGGVGWVMDGSIALTYHNPDEDLDGGINFIKRFVGGSQESGTGYLSPLGGILQGTDYNTFDLFAKKKFGRVSLGAEVPIVSGNLAGISYNTFAVATDVKWKITDSWEVGGLFGRAPGQPDSATQTPGQYSAFFFNPDYRLGLIMFNYQFANFVGPNTYNNPTVGTSPTNQPLSPYDNPIVNANYMDLTGTWHPNDKWDVHASFIYAMADQTASGNQWFMNTVSRQMVQETTNQSQSNSLGWEMDYGALYRWDEFFQFGLDVGFYFPGGFYAFSNTSTPNATSMAFATMAKIGISF